MIDLDNGRQVGTLDDFPRIHPRERDTQQAHGKFLRFMASLEDAFDLTTVETLQMLASYQATILKYALRTERHGDSNKAAGLADG